MNFLVEKSFNQLFGNLLPFYRDLDTFPPNYSLDRTDILFDLDLDNSTLLQDHIG